MQTRRFSATQTLLPLFALLIAMLAFNAFGGLWRQAETTAPALSPSAQLSPARALPDATENTAYTIRFLSERVKRDPEDFSAQNRLGGAYLQRLRATSDPQYLLLARRAAHASLQSVPAAANSGGLTVLALSEMANHEFGAARDHARRLAELDPGKGEAHAILGDALLELGDYAGAERAFAQMRQRGGRNIESEIRQARLNVLRGQNDAAQKHFATALALTLNLPSPPRETATWCRWQMGETAFAAGEIESAERFYRDALVTAPGDFRAQAGLGRVLAARGDLPGAIAHYTQAVRTIPDPPFLAALGDLHHLLGEKRQARVYYDLVESSASPLKAKTPEARQHAQLHARQIAIFYADHDMESARAYEIAKNDYATRRDIYGADALAWTALKAGHIAQAQTAMRAALRLNTQDARLFYHAGMIERAAGNRAAAAQYLRRALDLNAQFDPLQTPLARQALEEL